MPIAARLHWLLGPGAAFLVVALLGLASRLIFGRQGRPRRGTPDYGLLAPVSTVPDRRQAAEIVERLRGHGLQATIADTRGPIRVTGDGRRLPDAPAVQVLVFATELERARRLLA